MMASSQIMLSASDLCNARIGESTHTHAQAEASRTIPAIVLRQAQLLAMRVSDSQRRAPDIGSAEANTAPGSTCSSSRPARTCFVC